MPVSNTPSVGISVPIPTPVQSKPKPKKPQQATVKKDDDDLVQQPTYPGFSRPPKPRLHAVILPWTPTPQRMARKEARLPEKVIKLAKKVPRSDGVHAFANALQEAYDGARVNGRWGRSSPKNYLSHTVHDVFADYLQEHDDPRELLVRKRQPVGTTGVGGQVHKMGLRYATEPTYRPSGPIRVPHTLQDGTNMHVLPLGKSPQAMRNGEESPSHYHVGWEGPGKKWYNALLTREEFHNFKNAFPEHETVGITYDNHPLTATYDEEFE